MNWSDYHLLAVVWFNVQHWRKQVRICMSNIFVYYLNVVREMKSVKLTVLHAGPN